MINLRSKKNLVIVLLLLVIISLVGISAAYYVGDIIGNRNNSILLHTVEYGNLIVTYENNDGSINTGIVDLNDATAGTTFEYSMRFKVENTASNEDVFSINWINVNNTFCQYRNNNYDCNDINTGTFVGDDITYALYTCSEEVYNNINNNSVTTSCTKISNEIDEAVPPTGTITKLHASRSITIGSNATKYYVLMVNLKNLTTSQNYNFNKQLNAAINIRRISKMNLKTKILEDNVAYADNVASPNVRNLNGINFGSISSDSNGKGLYYTNDPNYIDGTEPIYYFRGDIANNNVLFAGLCWKIIRTTDQGGVKLIYNGEPTDNTCPNETGTSTMLPDVVYRTEGQYSSYSNTYVGYMYGNTSGSTPALTHSNLTNSPMKEKIDSWFQKKLGTYKTFIENTIYCNDRNSSTTENTFASGNGYSTTTSYYGPYVRSLNHNHPSLQCSFEYDKFTLNVDAGGTAGFGNNKLIYPTATITADEVVYAGGAYSVPNYTYYLYNNQQYWTMSPGKYSPASILAVDQYGALYLKPVYENSGYARPVITINNQAYVTGGNGTSDSPYFFNVEETMYVETFNYTGEVQEFMAALDGNYLLEVWGAQGGTYNNSTAYLGGKGGYSRGKVYLTAGTVLQVYVGGKGNYVTSGYANGGWNGGGGAYYKTSYSYTTYKASGGGATDISFLASPVTLTSYSYRRTDVSYLSRIIVAGGGSGGTNRSLGYAGGGENGLAGTTTYAGKQTAAGTYGGYGYGATSTVSNYDYSSGAGGGGWYGGGTAYCDTNATCANYSGGGSGFVWTAATSANVPANYSVLASYQLTDATTYDGSTLYGNIGDGFARITYLDPVDPNYNNNRPNVTYGCIIGYELVESGTFRNYCEKSATCDIGELNGNTCSTSDNTILTSQTVYCCGTSCTSTAHTCSSSYAATPHTTTSYSCASGWSTYNCNSGTCCAKESTCSSGTKKNLGNYVCTTSFSTYNACSANCASGDCTSDGGSTYYCIKGNPNCSIGSLSGNQYYCLTTNSSIFTTTTNTTYTCDYGGTPTGATCYTTGAAVQSSQTTCAIGWMLSSGVCTRDATCEYGIINDGSCYTNDPLIRTQTEN